MDAYNALIKYYGSYDEDARLTTKYGRVEFLTTIHYVEKYIKPGMKILEIGAGTGRYTHYLARQGYEVDAVELMPKNIDIFRANTQTEESVRIFEGNATDLCFLDSEQYDMTLMLGPMYHLFEESDKLRALSEAIRVTKRGGVGFAAYCCADSAIVQAGFMCGRVGQLMGERMLAEDMFHVHSEPKDIFELYRKEDIDSLMANFTNTERLHYVASDLFAHYIRETLEKMDDETFELYMKYHLAVCERADLVGATNHSLDIFRKK